MRRDRIPLTVLATALVAAVGLAGASAEVETKSTSGAKAKEADFPISCSAPAQKKFNQAVWILHSFGTTRQSRLLLGSPRSSPVARWATGASR